MKTYISIEDEDGEIRPKAVLESDNEVGISVAKSKLEEGDKLVRIIFEKIEEI